MIINEQHDLDKAKENVYILQEDSCTHIKSIGKPVIHNNRLNTQGAWMKDPLGIMGAETIFVMEYYSGRNELEEFENMAMFKAGILRKKYILPYNWDGTGGVVYGPYLYYNRYKPNRNVNIVIYNLETEGEVKQIGLSESPRKNYYQWGGYTGVDLAVEEQGLLVLVGYTKGNSYELMLRNKDVYRVLLRSLLVFNYFRRRMNSMGNGFVACGVVYCIDSYRIQSPHYHQLCIRHQDWKMVEPQYSVHQSVRL
ncbi:unnamed protein product [Porites evermanni]|uniref:Olfactomedin-like domain-containing protein n=1 Tax=Porites evermanni TaxID=104178 RepID=A0ABN8LPF8_9CNID|nr:unnamed protein product [Porites evermanni]